jgi:hypothetical protein
VQCHTPSQDIPYIGLGVPLTVEEMENFLGLTFITGIIKKPKLKMKWRTF